MAERNITQSLQNEQRRFKKVLAIYREMLFDQGSSKCVRVSHTINPFIPADEDYKSKHVIQDSRYFLLDNRLILLKETGTLLSRKASGKGL